MHPVIYTTYWLLLKRSPLYSLALAFLPSFSLEFSFDFPGDFVDDFVGLIEGRVEFFGDPLEPVGEAGTAFQGVVPSHVSK